MKNDLKKYFPEIRTREEIQAQIQQSEELLLLFQSWTTEQQTEFLDFCSGVKGVKMLYDSFICGNTSGKNIHFGWTDILRAVLAMCQKKCCANT